MFTLANVVRIVVLVAANWSCAAPVNGTERPGRWPSDALTRIRDVVFPMATMASAKTRSFEYLQQGYAFTSLGEVLEQNYRGADAIENSSFQLKLSAWPLESPLRAALHDKRNSNSIVEAVYKALWPASRRTSLRLNDHKSLLARLLAQRDLYQTFWLLTVARQHADPDHQRLAAESLEALALLIDATLFSEVDYRALVALRSTKIPSSFSDTAHFTLSEDYLPGPVVGLTDSWVPITNRGTPFRHFADYRGRSFVKVFWRAPYLPKTQLEEMRAQIYAKYGRNLHAGAVEEPIPKGFEAVLLRTIPAMLIDGSLRDSGWPEEVLVRIFKYPRSTIDLATSDFRGTLFYQYKLTRETLLKDPSSLGLRRVRDDDTQFFGFFGDTPDPINSYSDTATTMRENCISCHSETFYGYSTIFSFEREPGLEFGSDDNRFWKELSPGAYRLLTPEYEELTRAFPARQ